MQANLLIYYKRLTNLHKQLVVTVGGKEWHQ